MNKKGITLIALAITVIVLLILSTVSIISITNGDIIGKTKTVKRDEQIDNFKDTIVTVTNQVVKATNFSKVSDLAKKIEEELNKIKGFESVRVQKDGNDYMVNGLEGIEMSFEEATGKKLELYIDNYVKRTEIKGR